MRPANERRRYNATPSLNGRAQMQNNPYKIGTNMIDMFHSKW